MTAALQIEEKKDLKGAAGQKVVGAVVVGGEHPGLGITRSLGQRGIPVCIVDDQYSVSQFSKYASRTVRVKDLLDEQKAVDSVLEVGERYGLKDWVLFPTRDETVAAFSRHRDRLAKFFRVTTPAWDTVKWAWDKGKTYERALQLGIPSPQTWNPRTKQDLAPLLFAAAFGHQAGGERALLLRNRGKSLARRYSAELDHLFEKASQQLQPEEILAQEIIPGDGKQQYSYCAFFRDGKAHSSMTARRMRQHPREFGRAATYVESVDMPEVEELSERFLKAIDYYGLVEVEFKQDPRDGQLKLLDVNARTWGFHSLGVPAGIDFPYLLFADQIGEEVERRKGESGIGWLRLITDLPTAASDLCHGHMSINSYLTSLRRTRIESVFSRHDLLPSFAELVLLPYLVSKKYVL